MVDFIFIGPDKSGSSWLSRLFAVSSEVYIPPAKDLYFFDKYYTKGVSWYEKYYRDAGSRLKGEICHDYLFSGDAAVRIRDYNPQIKLFCSLRDPIDRSFSQYLYLLRSGLTQEPFEECIKNIPRILDNSLYAKHLECYLEIFDRANLRIFYFEDLVASPENFADSICDFLGINDIRPLPEPERAAAKAKNTKIAHVVKRLAIVARNLGFANLVGRVKSSKIQNLFYTTYGKGEDKPQMNHETRAFLQDYFQEDTQKLKKLLGRDELPYSL
ncbi:MAG: sulfotransferase [Opitutales bacterium]|nr:sulfotransferase [Opitutales bacterium]